MLLQAITIDDRAYDVEQASKQLHPHAHLPERLPAVGRGDRALRRAPHRPADGRTSRTSRSTTPRRCAAGARTSSATRAAGRARLRRALPAAVAAVPVLLRGGFTERRIGVAQLVLAKPRWRPGSAAARVVARSARRRRARGVLDVRRGGHAGELVERRRLRGQRRRAARVERVRAHQRARAAVAVVQARARGRARARRPTPTAAAGCRPARRPAARCTCPSDGRPIEVV